MGIIKPIITITLFYSFLFANFNRAKIGEYYEISGKALALLKNPKVSTLSSENKNNIIVDMSSEPVVVEILKTKGIIDRYYKVNQINYGKVKLNGWIWSKAVTKSKRINKEKAFYVKPIKNYNPSNKEIKNAIGSSKEIVGKWLDNDPWMGGVYVIKKVNGKFVKEITFKDGSVSKKDVEISSRSYGRKVSFDNDFGEYLIIKSNGNLEYYDSDGLFKTLKPIK